MRIIRVTNGNSMYKCLKTAFAYLVLHPISLYFLPAVSSLELKAQVSFSNRNYYFVLCPSLKMSSF